MTGVRTGDADPAQTLALLWREPATASRHGPAQRLSVDLVVDAAIALADSEGLAAVSMRRLADRLSVAAMTLYTYVPTKSLLLDLMLDSVYAAMQRQDTSGQGWRRRVTAVAQENRALFEAHSWAVQVASNRPPLGPGQLAKYEHELSALEGLDD
jgi:AcrR family transcriptional regulator